MKRFTQSIGGRGRLRAAGAVLALAGAITAIIVLLVPATASGRTACPGIGSRIGISKFDPHAAKRARTRSSPSGAVTSARSLESRSARRASRRS
jgi:hypothetical protein